MTNIQQANHYFTQGNYQQAEQSYRQLLSSNPNDVNALWGLGKVALVFDRYQSAYDIFQQCLSLFNKEPRLWLSLSQACQKLMRFNESEKALVTAFKLNDNYLPTLLALAVHYCEAGEYNQAEHYLMLTLVIEPQNMRAFCLLVRINRITMSDELTKILWEKLNTANKVNEQDKVALHYAFFTLFDKTGDHESAFQQLEQANSLQHKTTDFTVDDMQPFFNALVDTFNQDYFTQLAAKERSAQKEPSKTPNPEPNIIFIVGQPRSGSTLLEQMLIGHHAINTAGECPFFAGEIAQGIYQLTGQHFPEGCQRLTPENCDNLAQRYLKNMQSIQGNSHFIIDKMPANYQSIGLIKKCLPNAKVLHIKRDPMDVTWSIYRNYFAAAEPYFCSLTDIEKYHHCYERVMAHWQVVCPEFIHTIDYTNLISQPEKEMTAALAFCGLTFEKQCVDFSDQQRHISTLSDTQLREGIRQQQTQGWLPYKAYLPDINFK